MFKPLIFNYWQKSEIYKQCDLWSKKYPFLKHKANLPLFLSVILSRKQGTDNEVFALFKLTHLIFFVDDVYDDRLFDTSGLIDELFGERGQVDSDSLKAEFLKFFDDCVNTVCELLSAEGQAEFKESVLDMIKAMEAEIVCPVDLTADEYIQNGKRSVGLYMYNTALRLLAGLPANETAIKIIDLSAVFVRLSNDIRSYYREQQEDKTNLLGIYQKEGYTELEAKNKIFERKEDSYRSLSGLACPNDDLSLFKGEVLSYIDFIDQFYKVDGEFRDAASKAKKQLLWLLLRDAKTYGRNR